MIEKILRLISRVKSTGGVKQTLFMDKLVWEAVRVWVSRKTMANAITPMDVMGIVTPTLFGVPVAISDAMETNEPAIAQATA